MSWILSEEWLWIIILSFIAILVGPLLIVWFILILPGELKILATILIVIGWGVAAGYKDWLQAKRKEEEDRELPSERGPMKSGADMFSGAIPLQTREIPEDNQREKERQE
jgi:Flp pilus assembly protein TadB